MNKDKKSFKKTRCFFVLNNCRQYLFKILVKKVYLAVTQITKLNLKTLNSLIRTKKKKLIMKIY